MKGYDLLVQFHKLFTDFINQGSASQIKKFYEEYELLEKRNASLKDKLDWIKNFIAHQRSKGEGVITPSLSIKKVERIE